MIEDTGELGEASLGPQAGPVGTASATVFQPGGEGARRSGRTPGDDQGAGEFSASEWN